MKQYFRLSILVCVLVITGCAAQAQITRLLNPGQPSGAGIWLSGTGITGDATGIHSGETQISSIEDSILNSFNAAAGGAGVGKTTFGDLRFTMPVSGNSIPFVTAVGKGSFIASLKFNYYQKNAVILTFTLSDVTVSKYRVFSSDCSGNNCTGLYEEIYLSFRQVQVTDNAGHVVMLQK